MTDVDKDLLSGPSVNVTIAVHHTQIGDGEATDRVDDVVCHLDEGSREFFWSPSRPAGILFR